MASGELGSESSTLDSQNGSREKHTGKEEPGTANADTSHVETPTARADPTHAEKPANVLEPTLEGAPARPARADGKVQLDEAEAYDKLGFAFPTWKKWTILTIVFAVQTSMNFNASIYGNAVKPLQAAFPYISEAGARTGQMIFLIAYAFGCELWAPWSEELGRWPVLQASLFLVNVWQIPCALAPNFATILAFRFLGGLSSAGGSVTLGMVADLFDADDQQYAVAYIVLSSVGGSALGPIVGGFVEKYLSWRWVFWLQLIFGGAVQVIHFFGVPETRVTVMLDREARRQRKRDPAANVWGPNELREGPRFTLKGLLKIWARPFEMFVREPIVLCLSLLSGFSDALIFTFLESYTPVFEQWGFDAVTTGLAFIPILIGYFIAYFSFFPFIHRDRQIRRKDPDALQPERRLYWLLYSGCLRFSAYPICADRIQWHHLRL